MDVCSCLCANMMKVGHSQLEGHIKKKGIETRLNGDFYEEKGTPRGTNKPVLLQEALLFQTSATQKQLQPLKCPFLRQEETYGRNQKRLGRYLKDYHIYLDFYFLSVSLNSTYFLFSFVSSVNKHHFYISDLQHIP